MKNKKLYICGPENNNEPCKKIYTSLKKLKLENLLWDELGIYEIKISKINCIVEPDLFKDDDLNSLETTRSFLAKTTHSLKNKANIGRAGFDDNKEFKWHGTCDVCGCKKTNLTVVYSATLSGITVCRECRHKNGKELK